MLHRVDDSSLWVCSKKEGVSWRKSNCHSVLHRINWHSPIHSERYSFLWGPHFAHFFSFHVLYKHGAKTRENCPFGLWNWRLDNGKSPFLATAELEDIDGIFVVLVAIMRQLFCRRDKTQGKFSNNFVRIAFMMFWRTADPTTMVIIVAALFPWRFPLLHDAKATTMKQNK